MNEDRINEHYYGDLALPSTQRCRQRIHWLCRNASGESVLDIGCSQGIVCLILGREGFECTGVDLENDGLTCARRALEQEDESVRKRVEFQIANAANLPFADAQFDTVILGEILEHLTHPENVLREACRVLKNNGTMLVTVPLGLLPFHDHKQTYYPLSLAQQVQQFAEVEEVEILEGYIAARSRKLSRHSGSLNKRPLQWVQSLAEKTASYFAKHEQEQYEKITRLTRSQATSAKRVQDLEGTIADLGQKLAERQSELQSLTSKVQQKDKEVSDMRHELDRTNAELKGRDAEAKALLIEAAEARGALQVATRQVEQQNIAVSELREKLILTEDEWRQKLKEAEQRLENAASGVGARRERLQSRADSKGQALADRIFNFCRNLQNVLTPSLGSGRSGVAGNGVQSISRSESQSCPLIDSIRQTVTKSVPVGAKIAVISKGDDRLLQFTGRTGIHFPQSADGMYAGYYPANSAEAIKHLDGLIGKTVEYLVIPCTSFWWLDFYADFKNHLVSRYYLLAFEDDTCMVFALKSRPPQLTHTLPLFYETKATGLRASKQGNDQGSGVENADAMPDLQMPDEDERTFSDDLLLYNLVGAKFPVDPTRILLYGNVNTNVIDGSSVWLINVAKLLSTRYKVDVLLKAKITNRHLLSELDEIENVKIISPDQYPLHMERFGDSYYLDDYSAAELITKLDFENNYRFVFCRGKYVNYHLALNPYLNQKLVAYFLIDYYKSDQEALDVEVSLLQNIVYNAAVIVAQTQMLKDFICDVFHCSGENIVLLPPMVSRRIGRPGAFTNRDNICLYAGKFDLEWRIDDIIEVCEGADCKLQLIGNKFHDQEIRGQKLKSWVMSKAEAAHNIDYLGVVDHKDMFAAIDDSDFSISVRTDRYRASKEFSTKILEFGARGKPTIMNDSPINRAFVGDDYPLFANTNDELTACLEKVRQPDVYARAAEMCFEAAGRSEIEGLSAICAEIEQHLKPPPIGRRIAVISDDRNYCDRFTADLNSRVIKMVCPRMGGIKHDSLSRLLWWAEIVNVHAAEAIDEKILKIIGSTDKQTVSNGPTDAGLPRQTVVNGALSIQELAEYDNSVDFSVIIPCKDTPVELLTRALDSVLTQAGLSDFNWEIVIVDDESDPPVQSVLSTRYLNHANIRLVRNKENKGLGMSRNIGLERSRGRYIFFLDADDYYGEAFFAAMLRKLKDNDVVFARMIIHHEEEDAYEADNYVNKAIDELRKRKNGLKKVIAAVHACVKGYERHAIERGRLFFVTGYHEDIHPWVRFVVENHGIRIGYSESAVYYRTIRSGQSNQITLDRRVTNVRLADLDIARSMVVRLLKHHNSNQAYNHLIAWYEGLLPSATGNGKGTSKSRAPVNELLSLEKRTELKLQHASIND